MNQPKPRLPRHHVHRMVPLGGEYAFCGVGGCCYEEYSGKPVTGSKQRSRYYPMNEAFA